MKWRNAFGDVSRLFVLLHFLLCKGGDVAQILYAMKYHARKKLCCKMGEYMAGELCDSGFLKE